MFGVIFWYAIISSIVIAHNYSSSFYAFPASESLRSAYITTLTPKIVQINSKLPFSTDNYKLLKCCLWKMFSKHLLRRKIDNLWSVSNIWFTFHHCFDLILMYFAPYIVADLRSLRYHNSQWSQWLGVGDSKRTRYHPMHDVVLVILWMCWSVALW